MPVLWIVCSACSPLATLPLWFQATIISLSSLARNVPITTSLIHHLSLVFNAKATVFTVSHPIFARNASLLSTSSSSFSTVSLHSTTVWDCVFLALYSVFNVRFSPIDVSLANLGFIWVTSYVMLITILALILLLFLLIMLLIALCLAMWWVISMIFTCK